MRKLQAVFGALALGGLLLLGAAGPAHAQEDAVITGQVTASDTGEPLAGAQIVLVGTNLGSVANAEGRYRIVEVDPGQAVIRVNLIGYAAETDTLTAVAGETVVVDFVLEPSAVQLDQIVATVTGEQQQRELAHAVSTVNADQIVEKAAVTNLTQLLKGRAPAVSILSSSGVTGSGQTIRIRGSNSLSLSNRPIIYVDGIRVHSDANDLVIGLGGQDSGRLNDIDPQNIESIEILKGPSAATLYGTAAANGVILITTKTGGTGGDTRFSAHFEYGVIENQTDFPANFTSECLLVSVGLGGCTLAEVNASSFSPLEDPRTSPFETGNRQEYGISAAGGGEDVSYYLSASLEREVGVLALPDTSRLLVLERQGEIFEYQDRPNTLDRVNLRANVTAQLTEDLQIGARTAYVTSSVNFPQNDNNTAGIVSSAILGNATIEESLGYAFFLPGESFAIFAEQEVQRFIGSVNMNYQPDQWDWLTARATVGLDRAAKHDNSLVLPGTIGGENDGFRGSFRTIEYLYTVDAGLTASFDVTDDISSRTSVGTQYYKNLLQATYASGSNLAVGASSIAAAAITSAGEASTESITLGTYIDQRFGYKNRFFLVAGLRADDNSAFGQNFDVIYYPNVGFSYVAIDEQSEPLFNFINSLRLRAKYGEAGVAPGALDAIRFFEPVTATIANTDVRAVTIDELGNPALEPERSTEFEAGLDAGFFDGRLGLSITGYHRETKNALVNVPLAPSLGADDNQFRNLASILNQGIEGTLNAVVVDTRPFRWTLNVTGSYNDNEILELGKGVEPIIIGEQRHQEGFPAGSYFVKPLSFEDANDDGIIVPSEIMVGDSAEFLGTPFPSTEFSFQTTFDLFEYVQLSALVDTRLDFRLNNFTEAFRCFFFICDGLRSPDASLAEQARAVAAVFGEDLDPTQTTVAGFIEEADFTKLREVSLTFFVPDEWAEAVGARRLSLVFAGRNLATWTNYSGLDPELSGAGQTNFFRYEFLTQPPNRVFVARVNVDF